MDASELAHRTQTIEKFIRGDHHRDGEYLGFASWLVFDHVDVGGADLPPVALYSRTGPRKFEKLREAGEPYSILALSALPEVWIRDEDIHKFRLHVEALFVQRSPLLKELPTEARANLIRSSAIHVMDDIFAEPSEENIKRGTQVVGSMVYTLMKDPNAYQLLSKLSAHDPYTLQHSVGTAVHSIMLAKKLGLRTEGELNEAGIGGLLHDVGKVKVKKEIINKNGPLEELEWEEMRTHSLEGFNIVKDNPHVPQAAKLAILEHHEDKNGSGYPYGRKAQDVGILSKIVCVSDIFNALTTDRTYSKARSIFDALQFMKAQVHHKVDDAIFAELVKLYKGET
jgi:HD-GYP domain-containing protein (c-di-GMP phosphodiesterase class II)